MVQLPFSDVISGSYRCLTSQHRSSWPVYISRMGKNSRMDGAVWSYVSLSETFKPWGWARRTTRAYVHPACTPVAARNCARIGHRKQAIFALVFCPMPPGLRFPQRSRIILSRTPPPACVSPASGLSIAHGIHNRKGF